MSYYKTHPLQVYNLVFVEVIEMCKCQQNPVVNSTTSKSPIVPACSQSIPLPLALAPSNYTFFCL